MILGVYKDHMSCPPTQSPAVFPRVNISRLSLTVQHLQLAVTLFRQTQVCSISSRAHRPAFLVLQFDTYKGKFHFPSHSPYYITASKQESFSEPKSISSYWYINPVTFKLSRCFPTGLQLTQARDLAYTNL